MPKITRHGGPSHAPTPQPEPLPPAADVEREHPGTGVPGQAVEVPADGVKREAKLEGSWPGSSTATSSAKPPSSAAPSKPSARRRARTTENH